LHDLVTLEHPELHPPRSVRAQREQLAAARDRAAVVICVSQSTADAVISRGIEGARVVVVPNGVTRLPVPDRSATPTFPYLLAVGSLNPRKGLDTLVAAFGQAALPGNLRLVLAGPPGWEASKVHDAVERHGIGDRVIFAGRVTDAQLAALYESCVAVCVPSVAEGFGLPVLEAAATGAAVVASDLPVFHELAGTVALHAPSGDEQAWADALERIVEDEELRTTSARRGRAAALDYTWERTAALTVSAYERALRAA
jgi:glycosyltransferase involved in cell wall biosynthesis